MKECKYCGALVLSIRINARETVICGAEPFLYWKRRNGATTIITSNGEKIRAALSGDINKATGIGYLSHVCTSKNK